MKMSEENYKTCERIRDHLVACYEGRVKRCLECGEVFTDPVGVCECGEMESEDEWEPIAPLDDQYIYDVEYAIGGDHEYRSVTVMIACGGPNICVNTGGNCVELYWGNEEASAWLPPEVAAEIDDIFKETYETGRIIV